MNHFKFPLLLLLLVNIGTVKSQTKTDSIIQLQFPNEAVIAADNMNVLYIGMENPISVSVPGEKLEDITISCSDGVDVRMVKFGHYIAVAYPKAKDVYITTMVKGKVKGYTHFRVKSMPTKPYPLFGTLSNGSALLKDILAQEFIYLGFGPDFAYNGMSFTVTKYSVTFNPLSKLHKSSDSISKEPVLFIDSGQIITSRIKEYIKNAKSGDQIKVTILESLYPYRASFSGKYPELTLIVE